MKTCPHTSELPGLPPLPNKREQMILEGRNAAEIADIAAAYEEMGDSIDRPSSTPQPLTQTDMERIAKNLWILNKHKGINY